MQQAHAAAAARRAVVIFPFPGLELETAGRAVVEGFGRLVLQFLEGGDLSKKIRLERLSPSAASAILAEVADARFGAGEWKVDDHMRNIPDHYHAHARDLGFWARFHRLR